MPRPIQPKLNKDHWGFYQVGPYKTYSKLDAVEVSGRTKHKIKWNFNNEVFEQFDWTQEPPGDLDFWYRQRAEQLREYYDYIILFFSGGWDTQNILRVFVENNIFIDEIVHTTTMHGDKNTNTSREIFQFAAPYVKNLIENNPTYKTTKQTFIDLTDHEINYLTREKWDYFYSANVLLNPAVGTISELRTRDPNLIEAHETHRRVCQLYGIDKPRVWADEYGNAGVVFYESGSLSCSNPFKQAENSADAHDEMFYWTPDMPEVVCKQAHVIYRYLKGVGEHSLDHNHTKKYIGSNWRFKDCNSIKRNDYLYQLNDKATVDLIYKNSTAINLGVKPGSLFFGGKDDWLWNFQAPDVGQRRYLKGLVWLKQTVLKSDPTMWWDTRGDAARGKLPNGGMMSIPNTYMISKGPII